MPQKTQFVTENMLRNTPLPNHGGRYAVIPHGFIIDETRKQLAAAGFNITNELYKCTLDGKIAQGIYHLDYGTDKEMSLMFAWSNSYNKMMKFKCAVGAQVFVCMNGVVSGDMASYKRKHTGTALQDAENHIIEQISKAKEFYDRLISDKEMLKNITLTKKEQGAVLGQLFAEQEILTLTQVGIVKREIDKPTYNYNCDANSAWAMYNHITLALKESHPMTYLSDHEKVHSFFVNEYGALVSNTPSADELAEAEYQNEITVEANAQDESVFGVNFL